MRWTRRFWLASALALSCRSSNWRPDQAHLPAIAADGGFRFPKRAVLVHEEVSESQKLWIVRADEPFRMPGEKVMADPSPVRTELEKYVKITDIGELVDPMAERWAWENAKGRWRAAALRGAGGYFLHLEQFAKM
jgi:hypothetical protein